MAWIRVVLVETVSSEMSRSHLADSKVSVEVVGPQCTIVFQMKTVDTRLFFTALFPPFWPLMLEFKKESSFGELNVMPGQ